MDTCTVQNRRLGLCTLKKRVMDETGANATAFIHRCISDTNHAQQIIAAFKRLRWAYPDYAIHQGLKKGMSIFSQQQAASTTLVMTGLRHNQPASPQHVDKVLNNTLDETPTIVGGYKQQGGHMRCVLCTQTTSQFSKSNTQCDKCEESGMDDNHTNAL